MANVRETTQPLEVEEISNNRKKTATERTHINTNLCQIMKLLFTNFLKLNREKKKYQLTHPFFGLISDITI